MIEKIPFMLRLSKHEVPVFRPIRRRKMGKLFLLLTVATSAWNLGISNPPSAGAQDFYKDKTVTIIVAYSPGGSFDLYARVPDFVALAEAYGAHGERIGRTAEFEAAFERALASNNPAVLVLTVDPERISPRVKLSELQAGAR